ncbi:MAG TPA: hypothetical protein VL051_04615 [Burkholderiaceae bacterium]|nr:hypothetical protein [Burkholderiaceae bacterium]
MLKERRDAGAQQTRFSHDDTWHNGSKSKNLSRGRFWFTVGSWKMHAGTSMMVGTGLFSIYGNPAITTFNPEFPESAYRRPQVSRRIGQASSQHRK